MSNFKGWLDQQDTDFQNRNYTSDLLEAYLAGQAIAEQRVKDELQRRDAQIQRLVSENVELEQALTGADEGRNYANELLSKQAAEIAALKAQAGEPIAWADCYGKVRSQHELDRMKDRGDNRYLTYDRPLGLTTPSTPAAEPVKAREVDYCTDPENCRRCKTMPTLRGDLPHAGIGKYPSRKE